MIFLLILCIFGLLNLLLFLQFPNPPTLKNKCYDACLVLGCPTRDDGMISRMQRSRMKKAIQLYKEHKTQVLIISGSNVRNMYKEADIMGAYAIQNGVPQEAILYEYKAKNTYENLMYAKLLCKQNKFESILVVSSRFHIRRANFFVKKFFSDYAMVKTDDSEKRKHYLAEYIRMWNTLRVEVFRHRKI